MLPHHPPPFAGYRLTSAQRKEEIVNLPSHSRGNGGVPLVFPFQICSDTLHLGIPDPDPFSFFTTITENIKLMLLTVSIFSPSGHQLT
jgi:hypothetical protein